MLQSHGCDAAECSTGATGATTTATTIAATTITASTSPAARNFAVCDSRAFEVSTGARVAVGGCSSGGGRDRGRYPSRCATPNAC